MYATQVDPMRSATIYCDAVSQTFACELLSRQIGNSMVFTTNFNDNTIAGYYIDETAEITNITSEVGSVVATNENNLNGVKLGIYRYVDNNCECDYFGIKIGNMSVLEFIGVNNTDINELVENNSFVDQYAGQTIAQNRFNYPLVNSNVMVDDRTAKNYYIFDEIDVIHKDNKEIPVFSIQTEFCCETRDFYFTKYFIQNQLALRLEAGQYKVYQSNNWYYGKEIPTNDITFNSNAEITVSNNRVDITNITQKNVYIIDQNNKIMLGIKTDITGGTLTFYLNILKNRNKTIYNSNRVKIGEL